MPSFLAAGTFKTFPNHHLARPLLSLILNGFLSLHGGGILIRPSSSHDRLFVSQATIRHQLRPTTTLVLGFEAWPGAR